MEAIKEDMKEWATGETTAIKSGSTYHLTLPKAIERLLGVNDRDRLFIKIAKTGEVRKRRRPRLVNNFQKKDNLK